MAGSLFPDTDAHVFDTNLFVAFERMDEIALLERAAREYDVTLTAPQRVYDELTPQSLPYDSPPIEDAIDAGWVRVLSDIAYTNSVVSETMDMVRRYIAAADERDAHTIEQADAAVGGAVATLLERGEAHSVAVYTNDVAAFRGIERALVTHGYDDQTHLIESFPFVDAVLQRYRYQG